MCRKRGINGVERGGRELKNTFTMKTEDKQGLLIYKLSIFLKYSHIPFNEVLVSLLPSETEVKVI